MVALFVKKSFVMKTNRWPLRLLSSGASYSIPGSVPSSTLNLNNISQRSKTILLSLCRTQEEENTEYKFLVESLQAILENKLSLKIASSLVPAHKLLNFESAAIGLSTSTGIEVSDFFDFFYLLYDCLNCKFSIFTWKCWRWFGRFFSLCYVCIWGSRVK